LLLLFLQIKLNFVEYFGLISCLDLLPDFFAYRCLRTEISAKYQLMDLYLFILYYICLYLLLY